MARPGKVVEFRVMPDEAVAVMQIVEKLGLFIPGMSFAQAARTALRAGIEAFIRSGLIESSSGFDYARMLQRYQGAHSLKVKITDNLGRALASEQMSLPDVPPRVDFERERKQRRLDELVAKREADPENFGPDEQAEVVRLADELIVG